MAFGVFLPQVIYYTVNSVLEDLRAFPPVFSQTDTDKYRIKCLIHISFSLVSVLVEILSFTASSCNFQPSLRPKFQVIGIYEDTCASPASRYFLQPCVRSQSTSHNQSDTI